MIPTTPSSKKTTPITVAGRRVKRWFGKSTPRQSRKSTKHRRAASDATTSPLPVAIVPLTPELKDALKANETSQIVHDVYFDSETGVASSSSSSSSSSSNGHTDGESVTTPTSSDVCYQEPPSLQRRCCDECRNELKEDEVCSCVPDVAAIPLPPPRRVLPSALSVSSREDEDASSIQTSDADQIPDEEDIRGDISGVRQGSELDRAESAESDPWAQDEGDQWGALLVTNKVGTQTGQPQISSPGPPPAETEEAPTIFSSDGRMSLTIRKFLGAGAHGTVLFADWTEGLRQVAVKVSHKLFISELDCTEPGLRNLKNELDVLKALKRSREYGSLGSNFFPELFKSWQDEKNVYFVMELYPWNLDDLRWADPNWDASVGDKILWTAEMILGVQALHRMRILHRDIKPANVFVSSSRHIIIGDYGLAHAWLDPFFANFPSSSLKTRDAPGTMSYLAPEVVNGFYEDLVNVEVIKYASCGFETDIWSLGVTICESWCQSDGLFRLQEGEKHLDPKSAIPLKILQMDVQPAVEKIVDGHPIWHLITRMLDRNPKSRAGFKEILAHPVFAHLDWNRVANLDYTPTWSFPEIETPKQPMPIRDELEFPNYYQPPGDIHIHDEDTEGMRVDKLDRRQAQVLRRAMGSARDWVAKQQTWVRDDYDFDWTAPEVIAEDEKWLEVDD